MKTKQDDFDVIFARLKGLLTPLAKKMVVDKDEDRAYQLSCPVLPGEKAGMFFAAVMKQSNYVSFYFMPIYEFPEIGEGLSEAILKRKQGKSCFNFKGSQLDDSMLAELKALTQKGVERWKTSGRLAKSA